MKTNIQETRIFSLTTISVAVTLLLTALSHPAYAGARYWVGGSGNWLDTSNWALGAGGVGGFSPPASNDSARLTLDDSINRIITYEQPSNITLTNFWIDNAGTGSIELLQTQDLLKAGSGIIGKDGAATVNLSGGTMDFTQLFVGSTVGSTGTINVSGTGSFDTSTFRLGDYGDGIVNQAGGSVNSDFLTLGFQSSGTGTYTLDAGNLTTINTTATRGSFTQNGGTHTVTGILSVGNSGSYDMYGGTLDVDSFTALNFNHFGGDITANFLSRGNYTISGSDSFNIGWFSLVGGDSVNQTGGTVTVANTLTASGYTMSGGTLNVDTVAGFLNFTGGTLTANTLSGGSYTLDGVATTLLNVATVNGGAYNISNAQSFGFTTISGGSFNVSGGSTLSATTTTGGGYDISGASTLTAPDLGISNGLTVSSDSTLDVTNVTLDGGTLEMSGVPLEFATLTQNGGTLNPSITVDAPDIFTYSGGTFNGSLTNEGQTSLNASFTSGVNMVNNGTVDLGAGQTLTVNGTGLDNNDTLNMSGGTLTGTGALINDGTISNTGSITVSSSGDFTNNGQFSNAGSLTISGSGGFTNNAQASSAGVTVSGGGDFANNSQFSSAGSVTINGSGAFTNDGQFTLSSGALTLDNSGINTNSGTLNLAFQDNMVMNAGLSNSGALNLNGGNLSGAGTLTNAVGGSLNGAGAVTTDVVNSGTVNAQSGNLILAGSSFTNTGLVKNSVGSNLFVNSASVSHTGSVEVNAAGSVVFSGSVSNASGETITMNGGALSTAGLTNDAGGTISGFGSLTGDMTNAGSVDFFGNTSLVGDLDNQVGGHFLVRNDQTLVTGLTTNDGTIETLNGDVIFEGGLINNGALLFDPSTITVTTLEVGVDGYLAETGPPGDRFIIQEDFIVASDENLLWDTGDTIFQFNGGSHYSANPQILEVAGVDIGIVDAGWADNFMLGTLQIGTSDTYVQLVDDSDNSNTCLGGYCEIWSGEALYVGNLILEAGTTLDLAGINLYVMNDFVDNGGVVLNGTVTVASAVPVPAAFYLFGSGLLGLAGIARRKHLAGARHLNG